MNKKSIVFLLLLVGFAFAMAKSESSLKLTDFSSRDFKSLWYDGNAELSSYAVTVNRYGEVREGKRVLVYVTEPLRIATRIKPDVKLADEEALNIMKLNDTLTFQTGIYPYSVMRSVFQSVEDEGMYTKGSLAKQAMTVQEYCGMVYEQLFRKDKALHHKLYSYFESEGEVDTTYSEAEGEIYSEDQLWILIRNLDHTFIAAGEEKMLRVIPSAWARRTAHVDVEIQDAKVSKSETSVELSLAGQSIEAYSLRWSVGDRWVETQVEAAYPHRILTYKTSKGESGELLASIREPYWRLNSNEDEKYLEDLKLK